VPKERVVADVVKEMNDADHARRRDIYANQKAVHVQPIGSTSYGQAFDSFIQSDSSIEHHIEDPTLDPTIASDRYTAEDYNPPSFPDEDGLIDLIDHDRAELEKKKVKSMKEFIQKLKGAKRYDPAS
jgi:hypothetical protein